MAARRIDEAAPQPAGSAVDYKRAWLLIDSTRSVVPQTRPLFVGPVPIGGGWRGRGRRPGI